MYGLFAPVHKVAKTSGGAAPTLRSLRTATTGLSREKSGSQESVSSMSSMASSASRSRVRLGVTALSGQVTASCSIAYLSNIKFPSNLYSKTLLELSMRGHVKFI